MYSFAIPIYIWLVVMDIFSIYIIVTNKPFIFFESAMLEKGLLFLFAIDNMIISIALGIIVGIVSFITVIYLGYLWFVLIAIIILINLFIFSVDLG